MLCNNIGIFLDGKLWTIGEPRELIRLFGQFAVLEVTCREGQEQAVRDCVLALCPPSRIRHQCGTTQRFWMPTGSVELSQVFQTMDSLEDKGFDAVAWAVHSATLEDIFIDLATREGRPDTS